MLRFQGVSAQTSAYPFLYHPIAPTLSDVTLSFHFISISPYLFISFRTLMLLITYPEACYTDSLSLFPSYLLPHSYLPLCKITTLYLSH